MARAPGAGSLATVLRLDAYDFRDVWDWCEGLCVGVANFELEPEARPFAVGRRAAESVDGAEELDRDPDPILARLREEERMWFVTRWDDVQTMENHPEIFSAATEPSFLARTLGENMLDPPACTRLQKACKPPFLRRSGSFAERELPLRERPEALRPPPHPGADQDFPPPKS